MTAFYEVELEFQIDTFYEKSDRNYWGLCSKSTFFC